MTRPAQRHREVDRARLVAYEVARAVAEGAYTNLELPKRLRAAQVTGRDAAFATELVYGSTRMRGFYDLVVARAAGRPLSKLDDSVVDVLRLGAHQLLGMRVPVHAACDTTVALARQTHGTGVSGLVNAVMHRISEQDREAWLRDVSPGEGADAGARLAVETSHPEWIVRALRSALIGHGSVTAAEADEALAALLSADNAPAAVSLVARPGLAGVDELVAAGAEASTTVRTAAVLTAGGDPGAIPAVREGRAAVQDEGSQLVALALAAAPLLPVPREEGAADDGDPSSEQWLDMCAGPGGKAGLLAALAASHPAVLFANEVSEHRARLVRQTVAAAVQAGTEVYVGVGDGREIGELEPGVYDRVLVDAPCTGLGALRRRPEARWRRSAQDVAALTAVQGQLLDSALAAVRVGGVVLYATCSPHLAETRFVVADAMKRAQARGVGVEELDTGAVFAEVSDGRVDRTGEGASVQLWPHLHGTDGMFAALLRRTS
ncbi:16S rRNA (cytosine967-C5)-methyltransferase [Austwickia chelonae]|uniref:Putative rRNA methyltransferase n=1 Tax=Austwickia chelonae NBRC 105200 TaxID=1184607 RepID=K6W769_9MICO|nr:transcription antitermination factor NusB [Austwickia chelonae]GAB77672.1 putative rRNA methyltransferase [Austwickia chelonae NBRC 105200]SEW15420.1 16S rRNA (cytosine967-C5)-methyltransferase [Austwickia chelonae]